MKFSQEDLHNRHTHGIVNPDIYTAEQGIKAVKWSLVGLFLTAILQIIIYFYSGSIALLADTIHNIGDAVTAIPLWIAFTFSQRKPTKRFTHGYGRAEDLAGVIIVLIILFSAIVAGYSSIHGIFYPRKVDHLGAVTVASLIGFLGNEAVAIFRIKTGKEIGSAALIADGYHARIDGLTSLSVLFGIIGVWMGFPLFDPIIGLIITLIIFKVVWDSGKEIFTRLLDGIEPEVIDEIKHAISHEKRVNEITEVRVRWSGHCLQAEVNIAVNPDITIFEGHKIAKEVEHQLLDHLRYLSTAVIHLDPANESGEKYHHLNHHQQQDI